MGNCLCSNKMKTKKKIVLLLVGLDNAGKTVAAKGLAGEPTESVVPTVGFSVINLKFHDFDVKIFDLGGGSNIRGIWERYFVDVHGVIFVVDSTDSNRLTEVKEVFFNVITHEKISGKPILVLANKQDQIDALDEIDLVENLELEEMVNLAKCPTLVETCCAIDGKTNTKLDPGIQNGYRWLLNYITRNFDVLNNRVENDVRNQQLEEDRQRKIKLERLKRENNLIKEDNIYAIETYSEPISDQNGVKNVPSDNLEYASDLIKDVVVIRKNSNFDDLSSDSSSSVNVYYGTVHDVFNKPKSTRQLVKEQLKLEKNDRKIQLKFLVRPKTAPVHLYNNHNGKFDKGTERRTLKSAGSSKILIKDATTDNIELSSFSCKQQIGNNSKIFRNVNGMNKKKDI